MSKSLTHYTVPQWNDAYLFMTYHSLVKAHSDSPQVTYSPQLTPHTILTHQNRLNDAYYDFTKLIHQSITIRNFYSPHITYSPIR